MAPGNSETACLTVYNEGQIGFSSTMRVTLADGSQILFDVLDLMITDADGNRLYTGKLKGLQNTELGTLNGGQSESFYFTVGFPAECGNEYQNLNALINFVIEAAESPFLLQVLWEPPLEVSDVNVREGTIMPVRFHLENNGEYDTVRRGLDLIISGVDGNDSPVQYIFSVTEGTLLWKESPQKPYYELPLLDTRIYPLKSDSYYTATVKYGDLVLGTTRFKSGH
ncbi:MAG: hypothetical protein CVU89_08420 [Firmicutes bacterium HGW-Firmicutes-14]|nr:MAG: hypothetical protein CVU89_08420 [Firmicutes bacterium HGW-Firmicutes-14]